MPDQPKEPQREKWVLVAVELLEQMGKWSRPLQVKIVSEKDGKLEMIFYDPGSWKRYISAAYKADLECSVCSRAWEAVYPVDHQTAPCPDCGYENVVPTARESGD